MTSPTYRLLSSANVATPIWIIPVAKGRNKIELRTWYRRYEPVIEE